MTSYIINKARAYQPVNRKTLTERILVMLRLREKTNRSCKGGRKFKKLSPAAKKVLQKGKLSRKFWERFDTKHKKVLRKKRRGATSMKRVVSCTKEMAKEHIDDLAEELIRCGIMENAKKEESGAWTGKIDLSRIFNHDETPQFINYGIDGSANNVFYCGKGERCTAAKTENRECVTISPMVSLTGDICMCHVIFPSTGLKSNMAPQEAVDAIENLLISSTENGFITGKACLKFYELFDKYVTSKNIKRPVVVLTDGHSSRYDLEVLKFCKEKNIHQFVSPPDTTGLLQPLDQINSMLHSRYRNCLQENFNADDHVNRETFMKILAEIWPNWASREAVKKSFKRCGITDSNLDICLMQDDKFASAELVTANNQATTFAGTSNSAEKKQLPKCPSPENSKKGTAAYWKAKFLSLRDNCTAILETPISPGEIPELSQVKKFKCKKTKNFRITQTCGSLSAKDILAKREELAAKEALKQAAIDKRKVLKEKSRVAFMKCKDGCTCKEDGICEAEGLKQCPYCKDVMRSQCSKAQCRTAAGINGKPAMIVCKNSTNGKTRKKVLSQKPLPKKSKYEEIYGDSSSEFSQDSMSSGDDSSDEGIGVQILGSSKEQLWEFWKSVSPPADESSIKGKWFSAIHTKGNKTSMYIGRALQRFLEDECGNVSHLELDCLKPRIGNINILDGYPPDQDDKYVYPIEDVFGGPLDVIPVPRKRSWKVNDLANIESFYEKVKNEDRKEWLREFRQSNV